MVFHYRVEVQPLDDQTGSLSFATANHDNLLDVVSKVPFAALWPHMASFMKELKAPPAQPPATSPATPLQGG
jgi:hypothetical protein